ncbi:hypothetical protein ADENT20671_0826 [Actinomyces denticolens]|nr:hypothetical protein ADENT20671_0826 [Actinomyces denticolens]
MEVEEEAALPRDGLLGEPLGERLDGGGGQGAPGGERRVPQARLVADGRLEEPCGARGRVPGGEGVVGQGPGEALEGPLGGAGGVLGAQGRPDEALQGREGAAGQDGQGDGGQLPGDDEPDRVLLVVEGAQAQEDLGEGVGVAAAPGGADEGRPGLGPLLGAQGVQARPGLEDGLVGGQESGEDELGEGAGGLGQGRHALGLVLAPVAGQDLQERL